MTSRLTRLIAIITCFSLFFYADSLDIGPHNRNCHCIPTRLIHSCVLNLLVLAYHCLIHALCIFYMIPLASFCVHDLDEIACQRESSLGLNKSSIDWMDDPINAQYLALRN